MGLRRIVQNKNIVSMMQLCLIFCATNENEICEIKVHKTAASGYTANAANGDLVS